MVHSKDPGQTRSVMSGMDLHYLLVHACTSIRENIVMGHALNGTDVTMKLKKKKKKDKQNFCYQNVLILIFFYNPPRKHFCCHDGS